MKSNSN